MPSRISAIVIDANDVELVAAFWCAALGWRVLERDAEVITIGSDLSAWPTIDVARVPEGKRGKNRLHLDLRPDGTQHDEVERLLRLGARQVDVGQPADATWVTLADPEGNELCLLRPA